MDLIWSSFEGSISLKLFSRSNKMLKFLVNVFHDNNYIFVSTRNYSTFSGAVAACYFFYLLFLLAVVCVSGLVFHKYNMIADNILNFVSCGFLKVFQLFWI